MKKDFYRIGSKYTDILIWLKPSSEWVTIKFISVLDSCQRFKDVSQPVFKFQAHFAIFICEIEPFFRVNCIIYAAFPWWDSHTSFQIMIPHLIFSKIFPADFTTEFVGVRFIANYSQE